MGLIVDNGRGSYELGRLRKFLIFPLFEGVSINCVTKSGDEMSGDEMSGDEMSGVSVILCSGI